jgi:ribonuclease HII
MLKTRFVNDIVLEIGVDEAGRGPLWGPMMAAAVLWPNEKDWTEKHRDIVSNIKDSKKVTPKKRDMLYKSIKELSVAFGVGIVGPDEIDTLGATRANQLAFRRALQSLHKSYPVENDNMKYRILIDGILPLNDCKETEEQHTIIEGDAQYLSIAAASIVAKVEHDMWVVNWCKENIADSAKYDLLNCKGYGTAKHRDGILKYGYTDLHRRLYLRKLIPDIVVSRFQLQLDS